MKSHIASSFLPTTAVLELTYKCNHKCLFCSCPWYAENFDIRKEISVAKWKEIIIKLSNMGVSNFAFTGGEPLLKKGFKDIVKFASKIKSNNIEVVNNDLTKREKPSKVFLISNGLLMNEDILLFLKNYNVQLSMSLPGLNTFHKHTGVDSVDHVLKMFTKANDLSMYPVVNITCTNLNLNELRETIIVAFSHGASQVLLNRFIPGGRGLKHYMDFSLSYEEVNKMLEITEKTLRDTNRFGHIGTEMPRCIFNPNDFEHLKVTTGCSAGKEFFIIDPSGYVRVCNHSEKRLCHFDDIESLKTNQYWKKFALKNYIPEICSDCNFVMECDGGCREAAHIYKGKLESTDVIFISDNEVKPIK